MTESEIKRIREVADRFIIVGDDGYRLYWPENQGGGWHPHHLRVIADYMDELDKPWHTQLMEYEDAQGRLFQV